MKQSGIPQPRKRRRPARPLPISARRSPRGAQWLGAGVGLLFVLGIIGGLVWIVATGAGTGRWVLKSATPTPLPSLPAAAATTAPATPQPGSNKTGTISGRTGYPSEGSPAQIICAERTSNPDVRYCIQQAGSTAANGQSLSYSFDVPVGTYYVYATLAGSQGDMPTTYRAYFNQFVQCQANPATAKPCADSLHTKYLPVTVTAGTEISDIEPTDWYAL